MTFSKKLSLFFIQNRFNILAFFSIIATMLILHANLKSLFYNCFNAIDLGIYTEAIFKIADTPDWNPYLAVRNIKIFNDHFDPIIFLPAFILKMIGIVPAYLIIFEWLLIPILMLLTYFLSPLEKNSKLFLISIIPLSKGLLAGIQFPIHPTTWSILPTFLMIYFLINKKHYQAFICACILCLFKESFAFAIFGIFFYYLIFNKKKKLTLLYAILSFSFIIFELKLRKDLLGGIHGYADQALGRISQAPIKWIIESFTNFGYKNFFKISYPFIIPFYFLLKTKKFTLKQFDPYIAILFYFICLFGIHFINRSGAYHYDVQYLAVFLPLFIFSNITTEIMQRKRLLGLTFILFLGSSLGTYTKFFRTSALSKSKKCEISTNKKLATKQLIQTLKKQNISKQSIIAATGGIIPQLIQYSHNVYQIAGFSKKLPQYDFHIIEKNQTGDTYPLTAVQVQELYLNQLKNPAYQVILDSPYYLLTKKVP